MEKTCKIILVDDHSLFRNGLRGLLAAHPGYEVVGEAASGEEFLAMLPALAADVAFMDIAMPGMAGDEATVQALGLQPDLKIITLSMYGEEVYYTRMMTAGAKGFLLKDSDFSEVIEAIDTVSAGGSYICHELLVQLTGRLHTPQRAQSLLGGGEADAVAEPGLFDGQVAADLLQLFGQGHEAFARIQVCTQVAGQVLEQASGLVRAGSAE